MGAKLARVNLEHVRLSVQLVDARLIRHRGDRRRTRLVRRRHDPRPRLEGSRGSGTGAALGTGARFAGRAAGGVCSLVVAYEAIRYRESRVRVRHPESLARIRSFVALQGNPATNFVPKTCPQNVRLGGFAVADPPKDAV